MFNSFSFNSLFSNQLPVCSQGFIISNRIICWQSLCYVHSFFIYVISIIKSFDKPTVSLIKHSNLYVYWLVRHLLPFFLWICETRDIGLEFNAYWSAKYPLAVWFVLPFGLAFLTWFTAKYTPYVGGSGIPQVIASINLPYNGYKTKLVKFRQTIWKIPLTFFAMVIGASVGREGLLFKWVLQSCSLGEISVVNITLLSAA